MARYIFVGLPILTAFYDQTAASWRDTIENANCLFKLEDTNLLKIAEKLTKFHGNQKYNYRR